MPSYEDIAGVLVALDLAVFQEQSDGSLRAAIPVPRWFQDLCPASAGSALRMGEALPFLQNFLIDARAFWTTGKIGRLRSGSWTEMDPAGEEIALEATALLYSGQRVLLVERSLERLEERQVLLQKGREGLLEIERLRRLGEALRLSQGEAQAWLNAVPDLVFRVTRNGVYRDFEGTEAVHSGGTTQTAKTIDQVLPSNLISEFMLQVRLALESGKTQFFEYQSGSDWQPKEMEARVAVCGKDEVLVIVRDVTERKRAEAELGERLERIKSSRDDLLLILNQLRLGTALTDEERCVFLSQTAQQMFGIREDEVFGKTWKESNLFRDEDLTRLLSMAQQPQSARSRVPIRWERHDGRQYWMEVDLQDDPSNPKRKVFFFYDVSEVHDLRRLLDEKAQFENLVGKSKPMQQVYRLIQDLAIVDSTVLIEGETGTGKELVARGIYARSHRHKGSFVAVNCAGLTESLVASQLFGHRRWAFTGAVADSPGLFEAANGGVLFLDEIGDIPLSVQTSLLRVLQEREITRLGETKPRKVDVRVISATHRNLAEEVERDNFRADLLYRIRVARIQIPPLRERLEDIPLLVSRFLGDFRATTGKPVEEVSTETLARLLEYPWPGNVRELRSAIEFAVIRCRGSVIRLDDLPPELKQVRSLGTKVAMPSDLQQLSEKEQVLAALKRASGNRTLAAKLLGVSRATFYRRLSALKPSPE
ncbi:MAG: sigma 54-interacting transcriptional regulator [Acidobacteriota bacterium]